MNWIFLSLLAPFVYTINIFLDKYLIEARLPNYRSLPIFSGIVALPVVIFISIFFGVQYLGFTDSLLTILSGVFTIWAFSLYLEALIQEETSLIVILIQLVPVIVLALSYFLLGESITRKQFLGFILLFLASILISFKKDKSKFKISKALVFILLADILWAIPYILIKFVSSTITFESLIMYESLGVVIGAIFLLGFIKIVRNAFLKTLKKIKVGDFGLIMMNEGLFLGGKILTYMAVVLGPAALVAVLGSTQIFYGIIVGLILTMFAPKVFKEDLSKSALIKKGLLGLMAVVGVVLIS